MSPLGLSGDAPSPGSCWWPSWDPGGKADLRNGGGAKKKR